MRVAGSYCRLFVHDVHVRVRIRLTMARAASAAQALAARIVFAISPNSASCKRVFALLKNLFGEQQMSALADYVQASLMLNYNGRRVG